MDLSGADTEGRSWLRWLLPTRLLRVESAVLLLTLIWLYDRYGGAWWLFALLFLAPDLSAIGYALGPTAGAASYNAAHAYVLPAIAVAILGYWSELAVEIALIWAAHLAFDRALGYGLKQPGDRGKTGSWHEGRF